VTRQVGVAILPGRWLRRAAVSTTECGYLSSLSLHRSRRACAGSRVQGRSTASLQPARRVRARPAGGCLAPLRVLASTALKPSAAISMASPEAQFPWQPTPR